MTARKLAVKPTLYHWTRIGFITFVVCWTALPGVIVAGLFLDRQVAGVSAAIVLGANLVVFLVFMSGLAVLQSAEIRHGYLTVPGGFMNVDTVNPRTGEIIRAAGEPLITSADFTRSLRATAPEFE